ncbi:zinc finger protein 25-like isoform X2 [Ambystoma mexicanum]
MKENETDSYTDRETSPTQEVNSLCHKQINSGEQTFSCTQCEKSFPRKAHLVLHERSHIGGGSFPCTQCEMTFPRKSHLVIHRRTHVVDRSFSCTWCERIFPRKAHLVIHQRTHTGESPLSFKMDPEDFSLKETLQIGQGIHIRKAYYSCIVCGKKFTQMAHLERHKRVHTGERPFFCSHCGKCFNQKGNLQRHQRTHAKRFGGTNSERPLNIYQLGNANRKILLKTLGKSRYSCSQCDKTFSLKKGLHEHKLIHIRPYACNECEKRFTCLSHLIKHRRIQMCHRQRGNRKQERGGSYIRSLQRKFSVTTQPETDSESEDDYLEKERGRNWGRSMKAPPLSSTVYANVPGEKNNIKKHSENQLSVESSAISRPVVLKAATFIFKSLTTVAPPKSSPTRAAEETGKRPPQAPTLFSVSPPSVSPALPGTEAAQPVNLEHKDTL